MKKFTHRFVEFMPEPLEPDVIYVSIRFALVSHLCACGCGEEVVTPLSPEDWQLIFNGETVSLYPSIGNWNFRCRSHYWIDQNRAVQIPHMRPRSQTEQPKSRKSAWARLGSVTDQLWAKLKWWKDPD